MKKLLELLKDGHARSTVLLATELHVSEDDVKRDLEFLEKMNIIKRISFTEQSGSCGCGCSECGSSCANCKPKDSLDNLGVMWEVCR
ncbi:MAG: DeoR family transcriptional regulator [Butyrivibrio sp.]|nr:DeoR family transcriptional regulator [Butyrivibrio sp.]